MWDATNEPTLYSKLSRSKEDIVKTTTRIRFDDEKEERKKSVEEILATCSPKNLDAVTVLLKGLFPEIASLLGGYGFSDGTMERWYQQTRACHEDFFDRYFTLVFSAHQLTDSEIHEFIGDLDNITKTENRISKYIKKKRLKYLLDALENYKNELPIQHTKNVAISLINIGDALPPSGMGLFGDDPRMTCTRIILFMLSRIKEEKERFEVLKSAIENSTDFTIPVHIDYILGKLSAEGWGDLGQLFATESYFKDLATVLATRIDDLAKKNLIRTSPRISHILQFWSQKGDKANQSMWLQRQLSSRVRPLADRFLLPIHRQEANGGIV